jgi:hypothetical protein
MREPKSSPAYATLIPWDFVALNPPYVLQAAA